MHVHRKTFSLSLLLESIFRNTDCSYFSNYFSNFVIITVKIIGSKGLLVIASILKETWICFSHPPKLVLLMSLTRSYEKNVHHSPPLECFVWVTLFWKNILKQKTCQTLCTLSQCKQQSISSFWFIHRVLGFQPKVIYTKRRQ